MSREYQHDLATLQDMKLTAKKSPSTRPSGTGPTS